MSGQRITIEVAPNGHVELTFTGGSASRSFSGRAQALMTLRDAVAALENMDDDETPTPAPKRLEWEWGLGSEAGLCVDLGHEVGRHQVGPDAVLSAFVAARELRDEC